MGKIETLKILKIMNEIQTQLAKRILGVFGSVKDEREKYYEAHPNLDLDVDDIKGIINRYANKNSAASGFANLAPGPLGFLAIVPELYIVIRNQVSMIYDIGKAYGKEESLTQELLAGVFASAAAHGGLGILSIQGGRVLVKRASLRVLNRIAQILAVKTSQRALKSMVGKFVPVLGAAAMAAWSRYSTQQIGKKAAEIFQKDIEYLPDELDLSDISEVEGLETIDQIGLEVVDQASPTDEAKAENNPIENSFQQDFELDEVKIKALINLMSIDGKIHPDEEEYIREIVENANLHYEKKIDFLESMENQEKFVVDYNSIAKSPDDALGLLVDIVALSKYDGKVHISEKIYIKKVGQSLGFSEDDVEEMMAVN